LGFIKERYLQATKIENLWVGCLVFNKINFVVVQFPALERVLSRKFIVIHSDTLMDNLLEVFLFLPGKGI